MLVVALAVAGLISIVVGAFRKGWRRLIEPDAVAWAVVLFFIAYLVLRVQQRRLRFILLAVRALPRPLLRRLSF